MPIQIGGLASGLDTNKIIEQLMQVERKPLENLQQRKSNLEAVRTAWGQIKSKLSSLYTTINSLMSSSLYTNLIATSSDVNVLTASAQSTAVKGSYNIEVKTLAQSYIIASKQQTSVTTPLNLNSTSFKIAIGGVVQKDSLGNDIVISIGPTDTLVSIRDKINNAKAGVTASIVDNKLLLTANTTGAANSISFTAVTGDALQVLGLADANGNPVTIVQAGTDAQVVINGLTLTRSSNNISDAIYGVTLTLKKTGTVTLTVDNDTATIIDKVKTFVNQYNDLMNDLATKTAYDPNTKTKGVLQGDATAQQIMFQLRQIVGSAVSGLTETATYNGKTVTLNSLMAIGISTSGKEATLSLDENKLTELIKQNAKAVGEIFTNAAANGVMDRLKPYVESLAIYATANGAHTDAILVTKDKSLAEQIKDIQEQIDRFNDYLTRKEEELWNKFTMLEKAMAGLQTQSNWLAAQIGLQSAKK
ncbi:flagellar filament capping protein FliD [Carboxydothermus ferrireducens]|uniref:Flagellar hook-associated protein 2 n=1 Tax=Carboxydothermus ferrireducens DSM 11255 TaxID=1119529 RepID=A0ABX2R7I2_9THEO|nr:flagellar filament capping protein FliD [Carboxydothermus ferrireducens]NYE56889.1 flagellar hook-associated protein 2 [Carboxydothermus ferrireducens DSM 11255]